MLELIYPFETQVPLLPAGSALTATGGNIEADEIFPVVNENGVVTARSTRKYCHGGSMLLHPVVHLHIIDHHQRLYLQKRSSRKALYPGKWDTAVGGHVKYGETIFEALAREAAEELSLEEFNPIFLGTYCCETKRERELVSIFAAVGTYDLYPDFDEVEEGKWWRIDEIEPALNSSHLTPNFVSEYKSIKNKLLALL